MRLLLPSALALCCAMLLSPAFAGLAEGEAAFARRDWRTAARELQPLADQGNARAQYLMGGIALQGASFFTLELGALSAVGVIPALLGMVLGNGLTGMSLCLDELLASLDASRDQVETELALGATRWEAARQPLRAAVRKGMIPIINSMMVVGIVSLPGMMTGQILEGADPVAAVRYQIVIMFMIAAATAFGCMLIALFTYRQLFDSAHRLRAERITRRG